MKPKFLKVTWQTQHYKNRHPPWVKLHRDFLTERELINLPVETRLLLACCLILASETDNMIPFDLTYLTKRVYFTVTNSHITSLIHSGHLLASCADRTLARLLSSPLSSSVSESESESEGGKSVEKGGGEAFEQFFAAYPDTCPRKVRKTALIAWKKATHIPLLDVMLAALESQKQSKQWLEDGGQFIPAPSRWINEERWNTRVPKKPMTTMEAFLARGEQDDTRGIRQGVVTLDHTTVGQGVPDTGTGPGRH